MSNILDLSVVKPDNWIIRLPNKDEFAIPGTVSLSVVLDFENKYKKIAEGNDSVKEYKMMKDILITILKLDKENSIKVTDKYITDNSLDSLQYMTMIIEGFVNHVTKIRNDENLNSPQD